jgi:prepilin-type N-terminal cleavage/methylation domain-containing protein
MKSRGFTLLEVVAALAVLAVMASLAMPAIWGRMDGAKLGAAARQVEAAVVTIRTTASRDGVALALVAAPGSGGVLLRAESMEEPSAEAAEGPSRSSRVLGMLAAGLSISASGLAWSDETDGTVHRSGSAPARDAATHSAKLAVALPDGSIVVPGPLRIGFADTRRPALLIRINPWTGVCTISPAPAEADDDEALVPQRGPAR